MGTIGLQLPAPAIHSYAWKRRYRRLKFSPRRLLKTLTVMTPISTESSASGWQPWVRHGRVTPDGVCVRAWGNLKPTCKYL